MKNPDVRLLCEICLYPLGCTLSVYIFGLFNRIRIHYYYNVLKPSHLRLFVRIFYQKVTLYSGFWYFFIIAYILRNIYSLVSFALISRINLYCVIFTLSFNHHQVLCKIYAIFARCQKLRIFYAIILMRGRFLFVAYFLRNL